MVSNEGPKTGETLSDETIIRNMITFLIAGHETTSGLLSFLFYEHLQNPEAYRKEQEKRLASAKHSAFTLQAKGDQVLDGRYHVKDGESVQILLTRFHRDPEVYGPDAEEFKPSRMLDDAFDKLPRNAWKPFGNGVRACIGWPFTWQEALHAYISSLEANVKDLEEKLRLARSLSSEPLELTKKSPAQSESPIDHPQAECHSENDGHKCDGDGKQDEDGLHDVRSSGKNSAGADSNLAQVKRSNHHLFFTTPQGAMRFYGPSSGFSIFSAGNPQWTNDRPENAVWQSASLCEMGTWHLRSWVPQALRDDFSKRESQPLPSKSTTLKLVGDYFDHINMALPLFDEQQFLRRLERQYTWNPDSSPCWWAALNIVLALAEKRKVEQDYNNNGNCLVSLGYVKNALNVVTQLLLQNTDILAVQAMLGLALYFQDTANPQPLFVFSSLALRLGQAIGIHRSVRFGLSNCEVEERRNVFWIAYVLDSDICLRTGRPPIQDGGDYDVQLPGEYSKEGKGVLQQQGSYIDVSFFGLLARFAVLQRRVYDRVYSISSLQKASPDLLIDIEQCEKELKAWKAGIPQHYRPRRNYTAPQEAILPHVIRLHLAFHCCEINLHRVIELSGRCKTHAHSCKSHTESTSIALEAARSSIELIEPIKSLGSSFSWGCAYYPAAAAATLFAKLLADPNHDRNKSDLQRIRRVTDFISTLVSEEGGTYLDYVLWMCKKFELTAQKLLQPDQQEDGNPLKEKTGVIAPASHPFQQRVWDNASLSPSCPSIYGGPTNLSAIPWRGDLGEQNALFHSSDIPLPPDWESEHQLPMGWNLQDMTSGLPPFFRLY
ncbi:hypothetical protein BDV36DRAFT_298653 [Aspergillus pseudocaelatus]|uniref:Xylanolytic transcriptional activator regulatory domain-containing protein n=1 Tax=Aspergillus pseudocaelatus TaxID=1825620 RepID=A0ABQ6WCG4_9EURO|nr:hypothetical protein BDV36DRAFT_298653 [Aspergillus pseudocaelatus]